jgi:type I restriction enzyme S subunit
LKFKRVALRNIQASKRWALNGGPFGSKLVQRDYVESGVPVIRGGNLSTDARFDANEFVFVTPEKADELLPNNAHPGDLVFTQRGTLGQIGIVPDALPFSRYVISQSQMKLTVDRQKADPRYVYYVFKSSQTVQRIHNQAFSSGVPHINLEILREFEIELPTLPVQKRIASLLSAYDDLIENNTRRINILEEMAQTIYREWFVNLRFPGHEKMRMVESGLGPIPQGWSVQPLGTLTSVITKGTTPTTLGRQFQESGVNFVKVESITESGTIIIDKLAKIDDETHELLRRSQLRQNDILFSIAGAIGRVALVPLRVLPANTNQALAILRCSDANFIYYLLSTVRSAHFQNFSLGRVVQTAQANVSLSILKSVPILVPSSGLLAAFEMVATPIQRLVDVNSSKIEILRTTRDFLLSKLISGEIAVEAADEAAAELVAEPA